MAQDFLHGNFALLLIAPEATYNTDPGLTPAANAVSAIGWTLKKVVDMQTKTRWGPGFTSRGSCPGQRWADVEFVVPLAGTADPGGGALPEPDWAPLLKAAGFSVVTTGAPDDTHTYTLDSLGSQASVTFDAFLFKDGGATSELISVTGCVFDWKINYSATEVATITLTGMGSYTTNTNPAELGASTTYVAPEDCLVTQGATITIGGRTDQHTALEIAGNMSVEKRDDVTSTNGIAGFMRTRGPDASVTGSYDPEKRLTSVFDRWDDVETGVTRAFTATLDTAGGTRFVLAGPALQLLSPELQTAAPTVRYAQPFVLQQSLPIGDDEFSIVVMRTP